MGEGNGGHSGCDLDPAYPASIMTRPVDLSAVRNLFARAVTNVMGDRGEPAELGKSDAGPVFYSDGTNTYNNRVWARKGANSEVLIRVRVDGFNLPDTPGIPIRVEERYGIYWLVSWEQETYAPASGGGGGAAPCIPVLLQADDFAVGVGATYSTYSGILGPIWQFSSSSGDRRIHTIFPSPHTATQVRVTVFYTMSSSFTGTNRFVLSVGNAEPGESLSTNIHDYQAVSTQEDVAALADATILGTWQTTHTLTNPVNAGDLMGIEFERLGTASGTTNTGHVQVGAVLVEFTDAECGGEGGGGITWPFVAKGDLITTANGSDPSILSVGVDGQILTADAAQALGIKWADAPDPDVDSLTLVPRTAPATPSSGHILYVDSTDNILKSKGSSGTVTQLANP